MNVGQLSGFCGGIRFLYTTYYRYRTDHKNLIKPITMQRSICLIFILLNLYCLSFAQTLKVEKADQFFDILSEYDLAMGSIAISVDGVLQYQRATGYAKIDESQKIPATIHTKYRIGSVSKLFTAVILFQMVEEGLVSLEQTLDKYIPGVPGSNQITIRDMLYHRSGLPNYTEAPDYSEWRDEMQSKEELIRVISRMNSNATPGSEYDYSNTNYLFLSYIIEDVSRKSYEQELSERILSTVGLNSTYFENDPDTTRRESRSYKYSKFSWTQQKDDVAAHHTGAGALVSTPSDLITFVDALFSSDLVSAKSLEQMTSFIGEYGMGLFVYRFDDHVAYGHGGRINEYYTTLIHFPIQKLSIAYATNAMVYPRNDIMEGITRIWMNEPFTMPDFTSTDVNPNELDQYLGTYQSNGMQITVISKKVADQLVLETQGVDFEAIPFEEHKFANMEYGYFFEFNPEKKELIIKEVDNVYFLKR